MRAVLLRYALALGCILLAVLVHLSPAGPMFSLAGLFMFAVLASAWFGGVGPGLVAAVLATFTLPQLIAVNYPLLGGLLDLPRFIAFSVVGFAVGWGSARRARVLRVQERYARAMDASDDGFWDWIPADDTMYTSPRLLDIYGLAPDSTFAGRNDLLARLPFHPEDRPLLMRAFAEHFAGETARYDVEARIVRNGETRWVHLTGVAARDRSGAVVRWTGTVRDVTERKRGEEALRESEQRYEHVVSASDEAFWDWRVTGDEHYVSPRFLEIFNLPPGTQFPTRAALLDRLPVSAADREALERAADEHFAGKTPRMEIEFRALVRGEDRWIQASGRATRDSEGQVVRWNGAIRDVTARRRVEDALRESEQRYELAMAASESGYWDWHVPTNKYVASSRAMELAGFPPGTRWVNRDEYRASINMHPDDFARWEAAREELFAGTGERLSMEVRYIVRGEPRWHNLQAICKRDDTGKVVRWTGSATDITQRKLAEEALRESEQRYELAMTASESGYWDWHIPTDRYMASPRAYEMGGYEPGMWTNREGFRKRINMHPEDFAKWEAAREELFAGTGERLAMEVRYIVRGDIRWHSLQAICTRDDAGKVIRWTGSTTDITERKRAEEGLRTMEHKLRQAQRLEAMGTLAGGIAHDFNNILGAILGYGEMARGGAPEGSLLAHDIDRIMVAGERGRALVERVLAFSRNTVGESVPVHVERVVREVLDLVLARLPPSVTVHPKLHAGRAAVLGGVTQLHQVVYNLATNAIQAMPAGGTLRVELATGRAEASRAATIGALGAGEYVVLTVADTGSGMAPEIVDRIFDPFFTTKEVGTGTGLGLSLVHGIVTQLGGAIDVASALGRGSTFTVYLPRSGDAAKPGDQKESVLRRGNGQRVLVIDDEEPLVQLATRILVDLGYVPIGFTSSAAALAAFQADPERFDAIITDERMPEVSGLALIREVRRMRSSMPVVLMSGYLEVTPAELRESGLVDTGGVAPEVDLADEVLQKPLLAADLAKSLARVLHL